MCHIRSEEYVNILEFIIIDKTLLYTMTMNYPAQSYLTTLNKVVLLVDGYITNTVPV